MPGDVTPFHRFARFYHLLMPPARGSKLEAGLALAERDVERVADVAGGSGRGSAAVQASERVVVDAARGLLERVDTRQATPLRGDAARLPLVEECVDAALVVDALHHVADRTGALRECARILAPGGVLVVADFDPETVRGRAVVAAERAVGMDPQFATAGAVREMMETVGLDAAVVSGGFGYVVSGVRPALPPDGPPRGERDE